MSRKTSTPRRILVLPDCQVKPGVPLEHLDWAGKAITEYRPDVIVNLGDFWDMPSLSRHEAAGSAFMEGKRIAADIESGNEAYARLVKPMQKELKRQARRKAHNRWRPECHFLTGNHEDRISRAVKENPKLDGIMSLEALAVPNGWERHGFLEMVEIEGILFSHFFANTHSGKPIGGSIESRLNKIGQSFVAGHQQGFLYGAREYPGGKRRHGIVAGSFYLHKEEYRGAQGNGEWKGVVILNEAKDGNFDLMPLSMSYLERKFS